MIVWMKLKNKMKKDKKDKDKDKDKKEKFKSIYRINLDGSIFMVKEIIGDTTNRYTKHTLDRDEVEMFKKQKYIKV